MPFGLSLLEVACLQVRRHSRHIGRPVFPERTRLLFRGIYHRVFQDFREDIDRGDLRVMELRRKPPTYLLQTSRINSFQYMNALSA